MVTPLPDHMDRFVLQNPNGISTGQGGTFPSILQHLNDMQASAAFLPEINLDTTKPQVEAAMRASCRKEFGPGRYKLVAGSSSRSYHTNYKPGGCLALTMGDLVGRVLELGADPMGLWVYIRFNGGDGRTVTMVCTYQVCKQNIRQAGNTTAMAQQFSMLQEAGRPNPERVRAHHARDLLEFVQSRRDKGDSMVVLGDFNETIGESNDGLTKLCSIQGMRDPVFETHRATDFSTHFSGSKCIDYILVDPDLLQSVRACGYLPYHVNIVSDHRGVYIDVDTRLFFGSATVPMPSLHARDYNSQNIKQTVPYFESLQQHLDSHNWFERIKQLQQCIDTNSRDDALADDLDRRRIAATRYAGSKLKKFPKVPWSPEVVRLRTINELITMKIHQLKCPDDDCSSKLDALQSKLGSYQVELPETVNDCYRFKNANLKVLRTTEANEMQDPKLRRKHQEAAIAAHTDNGNTEVAKIMRKILRAEATKAVYQQCAAARGKTKDGGLSYVLVPQQPDQNPKTCPPNQWKTLVDPPAVEDAIRDRLKKHFAQSQACNLTSPPLDFTMKFDAACATAEQILTGTYNCEQLDEMTTDLIQCLAYAMEGGPAVGAQMTTKDLLGKLKVWKETTSTSPLTDSHLGHGKAYLAKTDLDVKSDKYRKFQELRDSVIAGHVVLLNYALHFGHSYDRWQRIVNAMLEKDPGDPKIHRLRVIHLYEWDFNLMLCVKWRKLLHHVCDNDLINPACYGTMPGRCSLDPVFIKELEYEISRMTRRPLVHFDNDATSCYDRIPCFLANLASRKYGLDKQVCIVQARTLEQAKYYLRTKFGISKDYAEHTQDCPWFGTGQGSGNSPFYWLLISSTLYDLYGKRTQGGAHYSSPDKQHKVTVRLLGFVDDVNNRTTLPLSVNMAEVHNVMEQLMDQACRDSQLWHDVLVCANQELELTKCKYHVLHYAFKPNGEPEMVDSEEPPAPLVITGKTGEPIPITHVKSSKAIKYLGCQKSPASQVEQKASLARKCTDYARVVNCSKLSKRATQVFYQSIYRLSVGYPLPMCYLTFDELDKIQKKAHLAIVTSSGFNRNTAKAVICGPALYGGANFFHLYDEQGYGQLSHVIKFLRSPHTDAGIALRIAMAWAQCCAGISRSTFKDVSTKLPHLECKWISGVRQYLKHVGGTLALEENNVPTLQRGRDAFHG